MGIITFLLYISFWYTHTRAIVCVCEFCDFVRLASAFGHIFAGAPRDYCFFRLQFQDNFFRLPKTMEICLRIFSLLFCFFASFVFQNKNTRIDSDINKCGLRSARLSKQLTEAKTNIFKSWAGVKLCICMATRWIARYSRSQQKTKPFFSSVTFRNHNFCVRKP